MADPYEALGVKRGVDVKTIRGAYRAMARRWHPDRFPEGPERIWAEEKMLVINAAYAECMADFPKSVPDDEGLGKARDYIVKNSPLNARHELMRVRVRTAEWNYLFGTALYMLGDVKKALTYLGVATHQMPENSEYAVAYSRLEIALYGKLGALMRRFSRRPRAIKA